MDQNLLRRALASDDPQILALAVKLAEHPLSLFEPRPDRPELLDQQHSFFHDRFPGIACVLGGNGSGKSLVSAAKVASFLLSTPPPEKHTPYWVLSQNMEMVTGTCWGQNLSRFIPQKYVQDTVWYSAAKGQPRSVILKPHANGNSWVIDFKSYDQGRAALQASNVGGAWFDEQVGDFSIVVEVLARTRKWSFPGSKIISLTPLSPDPKLEDIVNNPEAWPDWKVYRMNTRCNTAIDPDFVRLIEANELAELIETRLTGQFARFEGSIYKEFDTKLHVIEPFELPRNLLRVRGLDLGWNHYTACLWAARDNEGRYYVYREYLKSKTSLEDHVKEINDDWDAYPVRGHTYADSAAAQELHEFSIRGLHTVGANKEVEPGHATVQSLLRPGPDGRPRLFVFKTCPILIQQLRSYVFDPKTGKPKRETANYLHDAADALRYLCHSHRLDSTIEVKPLKQPERRKMPF